MVDKENTQNDNAARIMQIANLSFQSADKDVPIILPSGCKRVRIQCRDATALRVAVIGGNAESSTNPYWTIKANDVLVIDQLSTNAERQILYIACGTKGKFAEIIYWI